MSDSRQEAAAIEQSPQQRQRARIAGWLMALTFFTSIPAALILYNPVLNETDYILGAGDDTRITLGALLEIFLMIGNVGTAVVMFPILRRYSETLSLSYVASRTIEATIIGVGAISLLSVVTLRDDLAASIGADGTSLDIAGQTLVAIHDWTFLFGPGFCVGVNGILLGWLMYRTGLMPPRLAMLGVIGGPLIFVSCDRGPVRRLRAGRPARPLLAARGPLRGGVCDLPDRQGLQAFADPRRRSVYRRGRGLPAPCGGCAVEVHSEPPKTLDPSVDQRLRRSPHEPPVARLPGLPGGGRCLDGGARVGHGACHQTYGEHPLFVLERGEITEAEFARRLQDQLGGRFDLGRLRELYFERLEPNEPIIRHVAELRARGLRTALLTNNVREWEPLWRAKLPELDEIFELVVDSAFVGMRKPAARDLRAHARAPGRRIARRALPVPRRPRRELRHRPGPGHDRRALRERRTGDRRARVSSREPRQPRHHGVHRPAGAADAQPLMEAQRLEGAPGECGDERRPQRLAVVGGRGLELTPEDPFDVGPLGAPHGGQPTRDHVRLGLHQQRRATHAGRPLEHRAALSHERVHAFGQGERCIHGADRRDHALVLLARHRLE